MEFSGKQIIPARRGVVWKHLNDPETLRRCVPGCEELAADGDGRFKVVVVARIGPVKARFRGTLQLGDLVSDRGYRITGQGEGGIAGFGSMEAAVELADAAGGTELTYQSTAKVGGKLAQIGSRLVSSVANKLAVEFFGNFNALVSQAAAGSSEIEEPAISPEQILEPTDDGLRLRVALTLNGQPQSHVVEARTLLVDFIRRDCGATGAHVGCDTSQCGACTVSLDGDAVKSCTMLAAQAQGATIVTAEGLAGPDTLHPVQEAFVRCHAFQCGFCTPGMVMAVERYLACEAMSLEEHAITGALAGNICRCTGYVNIIEAVRVAANTMKLPAPGDVGETTEAWAQ